MKNGIVFIWSEKEILWKIMKTMEQKDFVYIENFVIVQLDPTKDMHSLKAARSENQAINEEEEMVTEKKAQSPETNSIASETTSHTANKVGGKKEEEKEAADLNYAAKEKSFLEKLSKYEGIEANNLFLQGKSTYFKKTKRTLLMFRKIAEGKDKNLELRHQRTPDVFFSTANPLDPLGKSLVFSKNLMNSLN